MRLRRWLPAITLAVAVAAAGFSCKIADPARTPGGGLNEPDEISDVTPNDPPPAATVRYGPLPPVDLPAEVGRKVLEILRGLPDRGPADCTMEAPLVIEFPRGHGVSTITVCGGRLVADDRLRGTGEPACAVAFVVEAVAFSPRQLARLLELSPVVRLTAADLPEHSLVLDQADRMRIARALAATVHMEPDGMIPAYLYPAYRLDFDVSGRSAVIVWCPDGLRVIIGDGLYPRGRYCDAAGDLLQAVEDLLPVPAPEELPGPARLFGADCVHAVLGGQRASNDQHWRIAVLVRILLRAIPGDGPPPGHEPVVATFSGPFGEQFVHIYPDGYVFEDVYYHWPGLEQTFFTTMHAG